MADRTNRSVIDMIDNLLEQANHEKQAAANLDLASDSKSKHPSADVSDGTRPAAEGARSAENKSDISKQVPNNVEESGSKNEAGGSKNQADTMGTQSMAADETKGNVDTPKSTDPQIAGKGPGDELKMKYGTKVSAEELVSGANALLKQLSAALNVKSAEVATPAVVAKEAGAVAGDVAGDVAGMYKAAAEAYPSDEEAGYVAASMLIDFLGEEKTASEQYTKTIASIQKQASEDAESYVNFLQGYQESVKSAAMPGMPEGLEGMMGGAGAPPEAGMGGGGEEAALAALAGAGGEAGLGGEGGMEGGEGSDDAAIIEAIAEALDEAGVTPEELAEAVAEAQGEAPMEGGEGMPPEGGGTPPEGGELAPAPAGEGMPPEPKLASAKSNRGQVKKAANRDALRSAVQRIVRGN